ncbi:hypothetical protein TSAR_004067 [Trichomalopsis sarcophagae]|uniref:Uncharacterized protein n=1 Tax=Trichomalopsis sarcophagae TaxID=543379 RepID=A0A232EY13_9HYME|nr:hypothetical protein TSAR_004067 [Trichomalopsis sarcophagae]
MELVIRDIYSYIISLCNENDMIGVSVRSLNFARGGLSLRLVLNFFYNDLWNLISGLAQSNEDFQIYESFILTLTFINIPNGGRGGKITIIKCLPRALIVGEAFMTYKKFFSIEAIDIWNIVRDRRRGMQKERASLLTINANVVIPANGGEPLFYDGRPLLNSNSFDVINLLYDVRRRHFDTILNLTGAARKRFFCEHCNKSYRYVDEHRCTAKCDRCFCAPSCNSNIDIIKCVECN